MLSLDCFRHVRDERIRHVLQVWLNSRGGRAMPPRRSIDPTALGRELEIVWICNVVWPGPRFRYRLAGESVNAVYGMSIAGRHMDELVPAATRETVLARYHRVVVERGVSHTSGRLYLSSERIFSGERIVVPLSEDGSSVDAILGATSFPWPVNSRGSGDLGQEPVVTFTPILPSG